MRDDRRWYVTAGYFGSGGIEIAGPFSTQMDALTARIGIEKAHPAGTTYSIDSRVPVALPTEPTLGWARLDVTGRDHLGVWETRIGLHDKERYLWQRGREFVAEHVIAFIPSTTVPTEALGKLRERHASRNPCEYVDQFLSAVDSANDGAK